MFLLLFPYKIWYNVRQCRGNRRYVIKHKEGTEFMWAYNETFYQIYPIGFCGAPVHNDGVTEHRILKLADWAEYLQELGIGSIILNPIFESDNHGYDTRDFKKIDCRLGTNDDFKEVCQTLHDHDVKIMLDGVFNHVGRGFWAFKDVQEKKWDSPYKDWFCINFDGNSGYNDGFWYEGWEGHYELVKLNLQNPAVVDYLLECVKMWIEEFGIDGLRLDVAYSLDHNFMKRLRRYCEEIRPGFALIGEVLFGDYNLIVNDEMLQSCTNYECYKGLYSSFNSMNMFEIAHSLNRQYGPEQWCIYRGKHLMTFADNGLLFGMPGIPCIYYGSEWGEEGQKAPDNDYALRPCFEEPKPNELTAFIKALIALRRESDALCNGTYHNVVITNHQLVFERRTDSERVLVAINASDSEYTAGSHELNGTFSRMLTYPGEFEALASEEAAVEGAAVQDAAVQDAAAADTVTLNGQITMPAYSVQYLKMQ